MNLSKVISLADSDVTHNLLLYARSQLSEMDYMNPITIYVGIEYYEEMRKAAYEVLGTKTRVICKPIIGLGWMMECGSSLCFGRLNPKITEKEMVMFKKKRWWMKWRRN